jgi:hypothetical protein
MRYILFVIIGLALVLSIPVLINRITAEQAMDSLEITVDMNDFRQLSSDTGIDFAKMTKELIENGVQSIAVSEITLEELQSRGNIAYMPLGTFMGTYKTSESEYEVGKKVSSWYQTNKNISNIGTYNVVITDNPNIYKFLENAMKTRFGSSVLTFEAVNKNDIKSYAILQIGILKH